MYTKKEADGGYGGGIESRHVMHRKVVERNLYREFKLEPHDCTLGDCLARKEKPKCEASKGEDKKAALHLCWSKVDDKLLSVLTPLCDMSFSPTREYRSR